MKFNDEITLDIAKAVSDVMEGKAKKEEVKYPHKMYHPETGEEVEVQDKAGHDKYNKLGYVHEKPKNESPEEPRAKGEKDFKDKHVVKKSGEKEDGTVMKEAMLKVRAWTGSLKKPPKGLEIAKSQSSSLGGNDVVFKGDEKDLIAYAKRSLGAEGNTLRDVQRTVESNEENPTGPAKEQSDKQKKYQAFFDKALKKFGVSSPAELEGDKKKEFFDYVDKNYEAQNEVKEGLVDKVKQQLANLKKKKDSGNSEMDDATIMKLASLLQKKGQLAQKMERHEMAARRAQENDDDDKADAEQEKWEEAKFSIDRIDDEIRALKNKNK